MIENYYIKSSIFTLNDYFRLPQYKCIKVSMQGCLLQILSHEYKSQSVSGTVLTRLQQESKVLKQGMQYIRKEQPKNKSSSDLFDSSHRFHTV